MKKTLLQKAKESKFKQKKSYYDKLTNEEEIELLFAWFKNKINIGQINDAYGIRKTSGNILYRLAKIAKIAFQQDKLKITNGQNK